jgi:hypothetical protein
LITFRKEKMVKFTLFYFNLLLGLEVKWTNEMIRTFQKLTKVVWSLDRLR